LTTFSTDMRAESSARPGYYANYPFSLRFRERRLRNHLLPILQAIHSATGSVRIIDIGGAAPYWNFLAAELETLNCSIVLFNRVAEQISAEETDNPRFSVLIGDARCVNLPSMSFDLVHSNSVIEHVGSWVDMRAMAGEVRRLAPSYFVQTPNFWFPYEPHYYQPFFHWLPEQVRARWMCAVKFNDWPKAPSLLEACEWIQKAKLLSFGQMQALFPDATIKRERFCGLTKSLMAIRHKI